MSQILKDMDRKCVEMDMSPKAFQGIVAYIVRRLRENAGIETIKREVIERINRYVRSSDVLPDKLSEVEHQWLGSIQLEQIELKNFGRLFYGDAIIFLPVQNGITALIGPNGSGKTTLLNGTPKFVLYNQGKDLFNPIAMQKGEAIQASIKIKVNGTQYKITRRVDARGRTSLRMFENGKEISGDLDEKARQIIPEDIAELVFGLEEPRSILTSQELLKDVTERLLLIPELRIAKEIFDAAKKWFKKELVQFSKDETSLDKEIKAIEKGDEKLRELLHDEEILSEEKEQMQKKLDAARKELKGIVEQLAISENKQSVLKTLEEEKAGHENNRALIEKDLKKKRARYPYYLLVQSLTASELERLSIGHSRSYQVGKIEGKIEDREASIKKKQCVICQNSVKKSSRIDNEIGSLHGQLNQVVKAREISDSTYNFDPLKEESEEVSELITKRLLEVKTIQRLQEEIDELTRRLGRGPSREQKVQIEQQVRLYDERIKELNERISKLEKEIQGKKIENKKQLNKLVWDRDETEKKLIIAKKEQEFATCAEDICIELITNKLAQKRMQLQEKATAILKSITIKKKTFESIKIGTDFSVKVQDAFGEVGELSWGEKDVVGLSLLLAIKDSACRDSLLIDYPSIAHLDPDHMLNIKQYIERNIPKQVILLAEPGQLENVSKGWSIDKKYIIEFNDDAHTSIVKEAEK